MSDVLLRVAGPRNILLFSRQWGPYRMHTRDHPFLTPIDLFIHRQTNPSHDAHTDDHIGRVSELDPDL